MKKIVTMTLAAMAFVMSLSSCSKDDDDDKKVEALATQVAGSYSGNEVVKVMGEESSNEVKTYVFVKASDTSVDLTIPQVGMGMMTIPALPVKGISLTKSGNTITGKLDSYEGVVTNASGDEKNYTISNLALVFSDKTIAVTFSLKYGNMPMTMDTTFTCTK